MKQYKQMDRNLLISQIENILDISLPLYSNLSNASALLNQLEDINWAGFYINKDNTLYLGPFQGEVACTKIDIGKGVCGTCLQTKKPIIVPDVNKFEGHIACSSKSKSEIVVPILKNDHLVALIDIDSPIYDRFNNDDLITLNKIAELLSKLDY